MKFPTTGYSLLDISTATLGSNSPQGQNSGLSSVSDWEWLLILLITMIVVWILIIIQAKLQPAQAVGFDSVSDNLHEENSQDNNLIYADGSDS